MRPTTGGAGVRTRTWVVESPRGGSHLVEQRLGAARVHPSMVQADHLPFFIACSDRSACRG
jgi:hypothetical protein